MPTAWPADLLHITFGCTDDGNPCSFGFWLTAAAAVTLDVDAFHTMIYDWYTFTQPSFLDCMAVSTSFSTCRIERRGPVPFVYLEQLAPNVGAQPEGQPMAVSVGLYLAVQSAYRGSGSRLHLPGLPQRFVTNNARLSEYGLQQLTIAGIALMDYVDRLNTDLSRKVQLVTAQQRRAGQRLAVAEYQPVVQVRPTLRLQTLGRRMRASGGFSS